MAVWLADAPSRVKRRCAVATRPVEDATPTRVEPTAVVSERDAGIARLGRCPENQSMSSRFARTAGRARPGSPQLHRAPDRRGPDSAPPRSSACGVGHGSAPSDEASAVGLERERLAVAMGDRGRERTKRVNRRGCSGRRVARRRRPSAASIWVSTNSLLNAGWAESAPGWGQHDLGEAGRAQRCGSAWTGW